MRQNWLNPEEWIRREAEVVEGYPERLLPKNETTAQLLKKRTLTQLYNQNPKWLAHAHADLDCAVAQAYGLG